MLARTTRFMEGGIFLLATFAAVGTIAAQSGNTTVTAQTGIYEAAGNETSTPNPSFGTPPTAININAGTGRVLTIGNVTGTVSCNAGGGPGTYTGADGILPNGGTCDAVGNYSHTSAVGALSGFVTTQSHFIPLTGVFMGSTLPSSAPGYLTFGPGGLSFSATSYSPQLGQVFFLGDGYTGTDSVGTHYGTQQQFVVPNGTTRLFLGFIDGPDGYSYLSDNGGSLNLDYNVSAQSMTTTPEPSSLALLGTGLFGLVPMVRRRVARGR